VSEKEAKRQRDSKTKGEGGKIKQQSKGEQKK
jgi:hypothetical protein